MGIVGRYIDSLSEEQKDRVVRAQRWRPRCFVWRDGARCLVGHAYDLQPDDEPSWETPDWCDVEYDARAAGWETVGVGVTHGFDALCDRFGTDYIVRLCKLRAGASVEDLEPVPTAPTSSAGAHG